MASPFTPASIPAPWPPSGWTSDGATPESLDMEGGRLSSSVDSAHQMDLVPSGLFVRDPNAFVQIQKQGGGNLLLVQQASVGEFIIGGQCDVPPDGDIVAGEMALYLDPTNGASALKIKAKSTNGTVVTGTVALA